MITIREVPADKFHLFKEIFEKEFDSDLPLPENSTILAACMDGQVVGFILAEKIVMLGQIFVLPEKQHSSLQIVQQMINYISESIALTNVVGAVASEDRFTRLFKQFGMQEISGKFFRRNIDF